MNILKKPLFLIAIDGYSASGKGTLARKLANYLNIAYLDTGKIYRLLAYETLQHSLEPSDIKNILLLITHLDLTKIEKVDLGSEEIAHMASIIAANNDIRSALIDLQRNFCKEHKAAVLDGRDIGTVILPDADLKLFITASPEVRAERRYQELLSKNQPADYDKILQQIKDRDERDTKRQTAPLKPAEDAHIIDTSNLNPEQVFQLALSLL